MSDDVQAAAERLSQWRQWAMSVRGFDNPYFASNWDQRMKDVQLVCNAVIKGAAATRPLTRGEQVAEHWIFKTPNGSIGCFGETFTDYCQAVDIVVSDMRIRAAAAIDAAIREESA